MHPGEFVGRGGQVGIETWGKELEQKLIRGIMYNLGQGALRNMPKGIVMIPISGLFPCEWFGKKTILNNRETIITCGSKDRQVCPEYPKCNLFMKLYEEKKDIQIEEIRMQDFSKREQARLEVAERIAKHPIFKKAKRKTEKIAVARMLVPFGTPEKAIAEIVDIATSANISMSEFKKIKGSK